MYERMLNKQEVPAIEAMTTYCGENAERFSMLHEWLVSAFHTEGKVVLPYGNQYGWIHYRVICQKHYEDIKKLLEMKCS